MNAILITTCWTAFATLLLVGLWFKEKKELGMTEIEQCMAPHPTEVEVHCEKDISHIDSGDPVHKGYKYENGVRTSSHRWE